MLCITNIFWAISIISIHGFDFLVSYFKVEWYAQHKALFSFIFWRIYDSSNAERKWLEVIMCTERAIATNLPFKYREIVTKQRILGAFVVITLYIIISTYPFFIYHGVDYRDCFESFDLDKFADISFLKNKTCSHGYSKSLVLWEHISYINETITLHILPNLILVITGLLTVRALRRQTGEMASVMPETEQSRREARNREITKLVLAIAADSLAISVVVGLRRLFLEFYFKKSAWYDCVDVTVNSALCSLVFLSPIIYFAFYRGLRIKAREVILCK